MAEPFCGAYLGGGKYGHAQLTAIDLVNWHEEPKFQNIGIVGMV